MKKIGRIPLIGWILAALALLAAGFGSTASGDTSAGSPPDTVRVKVAELLDSENPLPSNAGAIDLEELTPDPGMSFCQAFASAPAQWLNDSMVPVQYWVDAFTAGRSSTPDEASAAVETLLEYGQGIIDWDFKRSPTRPRWDVETAGAAVTIADVAVDKCGDLPMIIGLRWPLGNLPDWVGPEEAAQRAFCEDDAADLALGIEWYVSQFGSPPEHQQQIDTASGEHNVRSLKETGEYPDAGMWHFASEYHGIGPDGIPTAPAGSACDL